MLRTWAIKLHCKKHIFVIGKKILKAAIISNSRLFRKTQKNWNIFVMYVWKAKFSYLYRNLLLWPHLQSTRKTTQPHFSKPILPHSHTTHKNLHKTTIHLRKVWNGRTIIMDYNHVMSWAITWMGNISSHITIILVTGRWCWHLMTTCSCFDKRGYILYE